MSFHRRIVQSSVSLLLCFFAVSAYSQSEPPIPKDLPEYYKTAEQKAPMATRIDLDRLRERGKRNGWQFEVGYTSAFEAPLSRIAATRIPKNFLTLAAAQNDFSRKANGAADETLRLAGETPVEYLGKCMPDKSSFSWRDEKMLSPIENQMTCGSCWAFSAAAAFDGADNIRNGPMTKVSEQHILNCASYDDGRPAGTCGGGLVLSSISMDDQNRSCESVEAHL